MTEIHYHPADSGGSVDEDLLEFVEVFNASLTPVDLFDWTLNGIWFGFPAGTTRGPGHVLVVLPFDPSIDIASVADFEAAFGVDMANDPALFVGGFPGLLDDAGEPLTLFRADEPPPSMSELIPLVVENQAHYDDIALGQRHPTGWENRFGGTVRIFREMMPRVGIPACPRPVAWCHRSWVT